VKKTKKLRGPRPAAAADPLAAALGRATREHPSPTFRSWAARLLRGDAPPGATKGDAADADQGPVSGGRAPPGTAHAPGGG
jgi:hypothetical protein